MVGYMADFQSSVCDISATASVLSSSTARLISAAFRRCFDDSFATDFMDDREDYGEQRLTFSAWWRAACLRISSRPG